MAQLQGSVFNPATSQNADGTFPIIGSGRQGDLLASEVHGKWYTAGYRGATFITSTLIAGITVPVAAATLASKFTLWNPAASGKIVELISLNVGLSAATTVVSGLGLMIERNMSTRAGVPDTLTAQYALPLGLGGAPAAGAYSAASHKNVAIPGVSAATAVPIAFYNILLWGAVTDPGAQTFDHNFEGRILLGPDSAVALCDTVGTELTIVATLCWAEWPL